MCLVKGRFENKGSILSFRRSFGGPKHALQEMIFWSLTSENSLIEIIECCENLFVCHYWISICLKEVPSKKYGFVRAGG